jgi:hypothetical protein
LRAIGPCLAEVVKQFGVKLMIKKEVRNQPLIVGSRGLVF